MLSKKLLLALGFTLAFPTFGMSNEPGSGYYAPDCKHPRDGYNIIIKKDGTATYESDPDVYENILTSYSYFGNSTPSDFVIAILFDEKKSPIPSYKGEPGHLEIWKKNGKFYILENGIKSKKLMQCSDSSK